MITSVEKTYVCSYRSFSISLKKESEKSHLVGLILGGELRDSTANPDTHRMCFLFRTPFAPSHCMPVRLKTDIHARSVNIKLFGLTLGEPACNYAHNFPAEGTILGAPKQGGEFPLDRPVAACIFGSTMEANVFKIDMATERAECARIRALRCFCCRLFSISRLGDESGKGPSQFTLNAGLTSPSATLNSGEDDTEAAALEDMKVF